MLNTCMIVGRVGSMRDISYTNKAGVAKTAKSFTVGVYNKRFPNNTQWYQVVAYDAMKTFADMLYVGAQVVVSGRPQAQWYISKKGTPNEKVEAVISIVANTIDLPPKSVPQTTDAADEEPEESLIPDDIPGDEASPF